MENTKIEIQAASNEQDIQKCFSIMQQLRPHLKKELFVAQVQRQIAAGYHLIYIEVDNEVVSLAGYRAGEFLAWGKILYIDDFITSSNARGKGYGGSMMSWIIKQAQAESCNEIHLDTGTQRHAAHKLYLNKGFKLSSYHMVAKL